MYLAHRAPELFPGASFAVAHCNFRLRGDESDGDEAFVREFCASAGLECFVKQFDTTDYASEHGISIEMAARDLRYAWFAELCSAQGFDAVAVAHNADDNAETLILNLLRGTGTRGLRGMSADVTDGRGVRILRPMLGVSREAIRSWMTTQGFAWREDSSNASGDYKRNRIRSEVFPVFRELNPSFLETFAADMAHIAQVDDIADDFCRTGLPVTSGNDGLSCPTGLPSCPTRSGISFPIAPLLSLKHRRYVLYRILEPYGFDSDTISALGDLLASWSSSPAGTVTLSGKTFEAPDYIAVTSASEIIVSAKKAGTVALEGRNTRGSVAGGPSRRDGGVSEANSRGGKQFPPSPGFTTIVYDKPKDFNPVVPEGTLVADADKLPLPLKVRAWQPGDWMVPLGMKGRKKLSDLFVDLKWNLLQKQGAQVVEHPDGKPGHVAALLCVRIDDSIKITSSTTRILSISPEA